MFINTVPLRLRIGGGAVQPWLQTVQDRHQQNMQHAYTPLSAIQRCSRVPNGTPLFGSILVFENYPMDTSLPEEEVGGLRFMDLQVADYTGYPLTLVASPGETLQVRILYHRRRFDRDGIGRLFTHLATLLAGLTAVGPEADIRDLPMLDADEEQQLRAWSLARRAPPAPRTLVELFEAQVA